MAMESLLSTPVIVGVSTFVVLVLIIGLIRLKGQFSKQSAHQRQQYRALEKELQKANKQLLEVRSVVVGLGQQVGEQKDIIQHLNERIAELEHADNDGRLYTRASKMVQLGAGLHELIEECELPKAEAELMMSLQKKLAGQEKIPPLETNPDKASKPVRKRS
ncbi:DUF2802 domain-containing protein [Vibrio paucivorans]|uniref:DUF2802 domain-containing protein n=1 Tax=Vibrio paucivorans TaxID=2829489 RepID=A0A9X3HQ62_9VIBR|nr:DUF2802 domain-containing protein [Vibrio paucivorans]MCW8333056.1 DUF2802 domain-containing protein [Vibrio paucivorans]